MIDREFEFLRCGRFSSVGAAGPDVKSVLLGKEPKYAPDREFDTLHVRLELDIDFRRRIVAGRCAVRVRAFIETQTLAFDAVSMRILSASFEGRRIRRHYDGKHLKLHLPRRLKSDEEAEVEVKYRLEDPKAGLHFVPDPRNPKAAAIEVWSQGQPEYSKYWFPCHDAPHEKTTSEILATVPNGFFAVSNGTLLKTAPKGGGKTTYHWRMDHPHAVYLISLAVGRFGVVQDRWEHVPLTFYCEKGREADAQRGLGKTAQAIEFFSRSIGVPYPYEKYAQVCVKQFPGGMENTTATMMTEACLIDKRAAIDTDVDLLMSHELAHQWFGDLLTCRDWSHAWLNEGFATYFETLFTLHDKGRDEFDYELHRNAQAYFHEDRDRYRRPIVTYAFKNASVVFDRHLYEKAGWVLHMLRSNLGDELWWKAIGHYVRKHRYQSVETTDFINAIEEATGKNLRAFFERWIYKAGYPHFKVHFQWNPKGKAAEIHLLQTQSISDDSPLFKMDVGFRFAGRGWVREFKRPVEKKEQAWNFQLPGPPLSVEFDPEHLLLKKVDFRKPWAMSVYQLQRSPSALGRLEAAHEVARWGGNVAVNVLSDALNREKFWGAAGEMASALAGIGTPAAFAALSRHIGHRHPKVRRAILDALAEFKSTKPSSTVLRLARRDPSVFVEAAAVRALGASKDRRYVATIKGKLAQKSYSDVLSAAAINSLAALRDLEHLPTLRKWSLPSSSFPARAHAIRALASLASASQDIVPWLLEYVEDHDERVSRVAIESLGRTEDARAVAVLEKLRDTTSDTRVKTYADEAITRIHAGFEHLGQKRSEKKG